MEELESQISEGEIGAIALIVEVIDQEHGSRIATKFSDGRIHVNVGLLEVARRRLQQVGGEP
jgi:GTP-sensing pleiotropic transcriptional regulator CodY